MWAQANRCEVMLYQNSLVVGLDSPSCRAYFGKAYVFLEGKGSSPAVSLLRLLHPQDAEQLPVSIIWPGKAKRVARSR